MNNLINTNNNKTNYCILILFLNERKIFKNRHRDKIADSINLNISFVCR